eukprot:1104537-Amphidinium_carterae.1
MALCQPHFATPGYVNASFGQLTVAAKLHQPLGYLWLPVEPVEGQSGSASSAPPKKKSVDMADFELQISRSDAQNGPYYRRDHAIAFSNPQLQAMKHQSW